MRIAAPFARRWVAAATLWREIMAKRRAEAVEKKSRGPWTAIAAGVCFALALFCVFVLIASGGVPELVGVENVLRGLAAI